MTVTMNGCDYVLHGSEQVGEDPDTKKIKFELNCGGGGPVEIHIYNDEAHENTWCTVAMAEQANLEGLHTTNTTTAEPKKNIDLTGTLIGIASHAKGTCSFGINFAFNDELDTNVTLTGTNHLGEAQGIDIG